MTTTVPQVAPASPGPRQSSRSWVVVVLAAVVALAVGLLTGWALRAEQDPGATVLAGGGEMTQRQEDIGAFLADYEKAWQDGDVDTLLAMFAPEGSFEAFGVTYFAADGSLAEFAETYPFPELDVFTPWLLNGSEALSFHSVNAGTFADHVTLTGQGEILVLSHILTG